MSRRALLIGVGKYLYAYPDLTAAVDSDIGLIGNALKMAGVAEQRRVGEIGAAVSYTDLYAEIATFLRSADEESDLIIYYSGHGHSSEGITYLVPSDARPPDPGDPLRYLVPVVFDADLRTTRARSVSFVIDACRTPPADDGPVIPSQEPPRTRLAAARIAPPGPRTTIVYAASAGEAARVLSGPRSSSLFTRALAGLIAGAGSAVPLADLRRRLQDATQALATRGGLDQVPVIDVALGPEVDEHRVFDFFAVGPDASSGTRWSDLLLPAAGNLAEADFGMRADTPALTRLLRVLDRGEADVPPIDASAPHSTYAEPTLTDRLARSARLVLSRVKAQLKPPELLLVLGAVASLEAAVRAREVSDAARTDIDAPGRLATISPQLADAYPALSEHNQRLLAAWSDHVLALRVTIGGKAGPLSANLAGAIAALLGDSPVLSPAEMADDLVGCLHEMFLGRESDRPGGRSRWPVTPPTPGKAAVVVNGQRVAALTRLIWLLAADTRLLAPELGLGLVQDELQEDLWVTEALAPLASLKWFDLGEVIDLALRVRSAPLDQALRRLTTDITAFLMTVTQPDAPLHDLAVPRAATATMLGAADNAFRLPHIQFELSAAETYQLLMGTNLYGDARLAIRELYQNAVDACHYRRWRMAMTNPDALADWHPEIVFATGTDQGGTFIECRDNGVGMSAYELRESFAKVGRRFRDLPEYIDETASWGSGETEGFRPISQFGIGVLSYFMLAERLVIKTVRCDPGGSPQGGLEVRVSSAAGLFRLSTQVFPTPPNGGTTVRLYLRPQFVDLDLAGVLGAIIAAPTVDTTLRRGFGPAPGDPHWIAGELYRDGKWQPALAATDLGVYFHPGAGRLLVNGISVGALPNLPPPWTSSRESGLSGVTVSLDRRCRPRLSVDRGRLLSLDRAALQELIVTATALTDSWPDASVQWLLELFRTLPVAGTAAFGRLRGRDLAAWTDDPFDGTPGITRNGTPPTVSGKLGITVFDVQILADLAHGEPLVALDDREFLRADATRSRIVKTIYRERFRVLTARGVRTPGDGFPAFDDRLIRLLTTPLEGTLHQSWGQGMQTFPTGRKSDGMPPNSVREICQFAAEVGVSVGAAALYSWAVQYADRLGWVALTRAASGIDRSSQNPALRLAESPLDGELVVVTPTTGPGVMPALSAAGARPAHIDGYLATFPLSAAERAVIGAFSRLPQPVAATFQLLLKGLDDVDHAARRLARLSTVLRDPAAIAEISGLNELNLSMAQNLPASYEDDIPALSKAIEQSSAVVRGVFETTKRRNTTSARRILPRLAVVLHDSAFTVEAESFIVYFLSQYPAPEDASASSDETAPPPGLDEFSPAVRAVVSVDLDGDEPFLPPGSVVGALPLALIALKEGMTVSELISDLAAAGYQSAASADWDRVADAASRVLWFLAEDGDLDFDDQGRVDIADSFASLLKAIGESSRSSFQALLTALTATGLAGEMTERIALATLPSTAVLERHAKVLVGNFPVAADVMTLARMAALESISLGEAFALLQGYRPLAGSRWNLPEELPPAIAAREISPAERALLVDTELHNDQSRSWAELLVQTSVISGLPLREIVDGVLPLLTATGVPTDDLRRLSEACPGAITFDDLLILGCLQTWPDFSREEVKAITRPFCRFPGDLPARVTHWMEHASAWTTRSQCRRGRTDR